MTVEIKYDLEFYEYLDELRRSGKTNMSGARPYLMAEFDMDEDDRDAQKEAALIVSDWMLTFGARRTAGETGD